MTSRRPSRDSGVQVKTQRVTPRCDCGRVRPFAGVNEWGRTFQQQQAWERIMLAIATGSREDIDYIMQELNKLKASR